MELFIFNRNFLAVFNNPRPNKNIINKKKSTSSFYSKENSRKIINNYYKNLINEKTRKMYYL